MGMNGEKCRHGVGLAIILVAERHAVADRYPLAAQTRALCALEFEGP
jgi:hypothetical protein